MNEIFHSNFNEYDSLIILEGAGISIKYNPKNMTIIKTKKDKKSLFFIYNFK